MARTQEDNSFTELAEVFLRLLVAYIKINLLVVKIDDRKLAAAAYHRAAGLSRMVTEMQMYRPYVAARNQSSGCGRLRGWLTMPGVVSLSVAEPRRMAEYLSSMDTPIETMQTRFQPLIAHRYGRAALAATADGEAAVHIRRRRAPARRCGSAPAA